MKHQKIPDGYTHTPLMSSLLLIIYSQKKLLTKINKLKHKKKEYGATKNISTSRLINNTNIYTYVSITSIDYLLSILQWSTACKTVYHVHCSS